MADSRRPSAPARPLRLEAPARRRADERGVRPLPRHPRAILLESAAEVHVVVGHPGVEVDVEGVALDGPLQRALPVLGADVLGGGVELPAPPEAAGLAGDVAGDVDDVEGAGHDGPVALVVGGVAVDVLEVARLPVTTVEAEDGAAGEGEQREEEEPVHGRSGGGDVSTGLRADPFPRGGPTEPYAS